MGFSIDSSFNMRALLWEASDKAPIDINTLVPADSPWYLLSPGGINGAGAIAATAVNLNTFEGLQELDAFLFAMTVAATFGLEGGGPVLEEFLLPTVEYRRLQNGRQAVK